MTYAIAVLAVSTAPALAFLLVILRMDRQEPEPLGLVLRVIALGAASCVVAAFSSSPWAVYRCSMLPGCSEPLHRLLSRLRR